jgi:hypothetical protein
MNSASGLCGDKYKLLYFSLEGNMWGLAREKGYVDNRYLRACYENLLVEVPTLLRFKFVKLYGIHDRWRKGQIFYF